MPYKNSEEKRKEIQDVCGSSGPDRPDLTQAEFFSLLLHKNNDQIMDMNEPAFDDSEIVALVKNRSFTRNFDPVMECKALDAEEKLILAEVISYRANQKHFFKSLATTASRLGVSRSTVKRRMEQLRDAGFLQIAVSRKNFNQTNVVHLGPSTLRLFRDGQSRDTPIMSMTAPQLPETKPVAPRPSNTKSDRDGANPSGVTSPERKRPTSAVKQELTQEEDPIPKHVFRTLDYNPSEGRDRISERDAVKIFALYGVSNEQAWHFWDEWTRKGWPDIGSLEFCRGEAALCAAALRSGHGPRYTSPTPEDKPMTESPPFDEDPTAWLEE